MNLNGLEIAVIRSPRKKSMHIVIERDGTVSVQVPEALEEERILSILKLKEYEIHKKLLNWKELNNERIERQYLSGQSFMYLGKNYNLQVVEGQKQNLIFKNGKFLLSDKAVSPRNAFVKFYKKQASLKIGERLLLYQGAVNKMPGKIEIRELPTRWASCTPSGNIYFNWKCVMAPIVVLDYLIIHELVHLEYPNHSRAFWDKVSTICSNYQQQETWLKRNGVRMSI
jgi:predicted metal-dependent hydrolase